MKNQNSLPVNSSNPPELTGNEEEAFGDMSPAAARALLEFLERCTFTEMDRERCRVKRGLSAETWAEMGLKSGPTSNRELIEDIAKRYTPAQMMEAGLFTQKRRGDPPQPNAQLCGYGLVG